MTFPAFRFEIGDAIVMDDALYSILSKDGGGPLLKAMGVAGAKVPLTWEEFWQRYHARNLRVVRAVAGALPEAVVGNLSEQFDVFDPRWKDAALVRLDYVQFCDQFFSRPNRRKHRYAKRPEGFKQIADFVARLRRRRAAQAQGKRYSQIPLENFSGSTLRDWFRRWERSHRDLRAILPCHDAKGLGGLRIDDEAVYVFGKQIRELYLTDERPDASVVYQCAVNDIDQLNAGRLIPVTAPSYKTFLRCIGQWITPYDKMRLRWGQKTADQKFRHVKRAPKAQFPMEVVEIDHTPLDIVLTDDNGKRARGDKRKKETYKVWLTVARCQATRMVVGFHLSRDAPSWTSVMSCLRMAILPKDLEGIKVQSPYPVFGLPRTLKMDNGTEFHSQSLKAAAGQLHINLCYMPRGVPHLKGGIERTCGIINRDFLAFLSGKTHGNPVARGEYLSERRAAFSLEKIHEMLTIYIVDILHNRPMGALLGRTPLQMWEQLAPNGVEMPGNPQDLDTALALTVNRTVTNVGVTFLGLVYQSKELQTTRKGLGHMGQKLMVKVDPYDLGSILVLDEGDGVGAGKSKWISAPCLYPELANGVSVVQWKETVALARQNTEEGQRVALTILRRARALLAEEAARLRTSPPKLRQFDADWARDHVDDPIFDIAALDDSAGDAPTHRGRGRPRAASPTPDHRVGDGGHAPGDPAPDVAEIEVASATDAPDFQSSFDAETDSVVSQPTPNTGEVYFDDVDLNDPANWDA